MSVSIAGYVIDPERRGVVPFPAQDLRFKAC
jgi:hypothetical protein